MSGSGETRDQLALRADAVSVERSGRVMLADFALSAAVGGVTALTGPNGAGKTTALRALAGLVPCGGSIQLFGRGLTTLSLRERARWLAYVPQQSALQLGITVRDIVSQGRYAHAGAWSAWPTWPSSNASHAPAVERALNDSDLVALAARPWDQLSGGEQRRVLLARALATEAPIVLLDEPTAALDVAHALRFLDLLRTLAAAGRCIVLVLHDLQQVMRYADHVLLLDRGRVVAQGTPTEIIRGPQIRSVYGVELEENSALGFRLPSTHSETTP